MGVIQSSPAPFCTNGHPLNISDSEDGDYIGGFVCNMCGSTSSSPDFDGLQHRRWHCPDCSYDCCLTCRQEFFVIESDLLHIDLKSNNVRSNLAELVNAIRDDDRAREYLMRRYRLVPKLIEILSNCSEDEQELVLEAIWYFTRNSYSVSRIYRSSLLVYLVDSLANVTNLNNLKKITRSVYNIALSSPQSSETSGIEALSNVSNFIPNLSGPLLLEDSELLTVALDLLDCLSNSTLYFKSELVYPDTAVLRALPTLLTRGDGIASRTAYFMWVMVAVDNNKRAFCTCDGILAALRRLIEEDFDGARGNAFGTLWNLAALASNKVIICQPSLGLLPILVRLIEDADEGTKVSALGVTSNLSVEVQNKPLLLDPSLNILPALVRQVRENESTPRVTACQTLMNLAASEGGSAEIMSTGVHVDLLAIIRNAPNDPSEWGGGSNEKVYSNTCLMNLAEWEANRAALKRDGAVEVLGPLLTYNHFHSLTASMAYAFLVGRDEKGPHIEVLKSGVIIIERLIDLLENTIAKSGGDGYQYGLFRMEVVVHACLELAVSDANKLKLAVPRVRDLLIDVIRNACPGGDGVDLYNSEEEVLKAANLAVETLLQISFIHEDSRELVSDSGLFPPPCGLLPVLSTFAIHTNADMTGTPIGLLMSRLTQKPLPNCASLDSSHASSSSAFKHIMISYSWNKRAKPELVSALSRALRQRGYEVWRDVEGSSYVPPMSGLSDETMARAIETSAAVVVCISKEYKQSPHCRIEANYANQRCKNGKLKVIFVMLQEEYTTVSEPESVDGYLSVMIGDSIWIPMYNDNHVLSAADFISDIVGNTAKRVDGFMKSNKSPIIDDSPYNHDSKVAMLEAKVFGLESKVESLVSIINKEFGFVKARLGRVEGDKNEFVFHS